MSMSVSASTSVSRPRAASSRRVPLLWKLLATTPLFSGGCPVRIAAWVEDVTVGLTGITRRTRSGMSAKSPYASTASAARASKERRTTRLATALVRGSGGGGGGRAGGGGGGGGRAVQDTERSRMQNAECRMLNVEC